MPRSIGLSVSTIAISLVVVITNLGNLIVAPVLPAIMDYFGSSTAEVALMVSAFGFGRLAMDLPAGVLTERVNPIKLFTAGILLSGVAAALAAFSDSLLQLIIFRAAMGVGSAMMSTVALVMLVNSARPDQRSKVLSFYTSAMLSGSAISPMIGGYLATVFDWRAVFLFCALTPLISLPLNLIITSRAVGRLQSGPTGEKPALGHKPSRSRISGGARPTSTNWRALITVYLGALLGLFNRQGMQSALLPLYGGSVLGLSAVAIGGVLSSRAIFTIIITLPAGALADRFGRKKLLIPGLALMAAGNLYLLTGESMAIFTLATFLVSMGVVGNSMLSALVGDLVPERQLGKGMGMYRFSCDLGTVLGPFVLGLIVDHFGFPTASVAGAAVVMLGLVACTLLVPSGTGATPARRVAQA